MRRRLRILFTIALLLPAASAFAQSGKIAGVVRDGGTGDPLPGVNVVLDGTTQGTTTDVDGYYAILNVRPGTYDVRATFVGYTPAIQQDVRVNIDLTTEVNFNLQEQTVGLDEVVVAAERPVVQRDVSASVANISSEDIVNLPVTDVERVVGLQAGFERGLDIRGGGGSQVQFMVDGFSTQSGRDNVAFTGISYTAVDEVQVQTGGFNAEYGNVRSGLVNVVTKDGDRDRYSVDAIVRYSAPSQKYFNNTTIDGQEVGLPNEDMAYYARPYFDPAVAMEGVNNGSWDQYMLDSYPTSFSQGWQGLADTYNATNGTSVTPQQMQEAYRWYLRKDFELSQPDYEVDATIAGPFPVLSRALGDLRFSGSYRQEQSAFIVPMIRDTYKERTFQGKLTSDIAKGMKLQVNGMWAKQMGINDNEVGYPNMWTGEMPYYPWDGGPYLANNIGGPEIFASHFRNPMDVTRSMFGAELTHTLNSNTFYQVQLQRIFTDYFTYADDPRDPSILQTIGPIQLTEEPFGFEYRDANDVLGVGFRTGGHWFSARDTSNTTRWTAKFDITSQLNRYAQIKTGLEYIYSNYDTNFGEVDPAHPHHTNPKFVWSKSPQQGGAYAQSKLEFQGMVANVGVRLDYFHAGGDWYEYSPYSRVLTAQYGRRALDTPDALERDDWGLTSTERQFALSPRLGVSFPITENSKLYFNYGHFRSMPNPMSIFNIEEINTGRVNFIGNPNLPMQKTVQYELGFEQNLSNQFLLRLAGYYKDLSDQGRTVNFQSIDGEVNYSTVLPYNYGDIRGFEASIYKNQGAWIRGFVNYTYMVSKGGNFGFSNVYENRVSMRNYLLTSSDYYPSTPIPEPYARFNIELLVPDDFGPSVAGISPIADWRVTFLGEWRQGQTLTFNGQSLAGGRSSSRELQGNVNTKDFYTLDLRFAKNFNTAVGDAQFFIDVTNVLNLRHMFTYGSGTDQERYLRSLHLDEDTFSGYESGRPNNYNMIPGDDVVGDYRRPGVPFVPIRVGDLPESGMTLSYNLGDYSPYNSPLYYVPNACDGEPYCGGTYYQWTGDQFVEADSGFVGEVKDDRAYIDMPNTLYDTFLNPRNVFFGLRISL